VWLQSVQGGAPGTPRHSKSCAHGAKKCSLGAPRAHQTLEIRCFTMRKRSFSQNQQIHPFVYFWHRFCSRGAQKRCQRCQRGATRERPGEPPRLQGCHKVPKKVIQNDHTCHHRGTERPKAVAGGTREPVGVPPLMANPVNKRENTADKKRKNRRSEHDSRGHSRRHHGTHMPPA